MQEKPMRFLARLAADEYGDSDELAPLVLLHGLTFDRGLWLPVLNELRRTDPRRRVLVIDLQVMVIHHRGRRMPPAVLPRRCTAPSWRPSSHLP
jgi:pimeloyl-ACP methyl ester carboxylesterase